MVQPQSHANGRIERQTEPKNIACHFSEMGHMKSLLLTYDNRFGESVSKKWPHTTISPIELSTSSHFRHAENLEFRIQ